jgi:hypothetical protein
MMQEKKQAAVESVLFFLAEFTPFSNKEIAEKNEKKMNSFPSY